MSEKKKILVFIDWFLPGYKAGGPIRSVANMVDALHEYFDVYIVTSDRDYLETEAYPGIEKDKWVDFEYKAMVFYFSKDRLNKKNLLILIKNTSFDYAYINGIYSYFFSVLPLILLKKTDKKIIIAPRGMLSKQAFSAKQVKKKSYLFIAKLLGLFKGVYFQATVVKEAEDIKNALSNKTKIIIAPNLPRKLITKETINIIKKKGALKLVSIARISAEKNTLFSLEVLVSTDFSGTIEFDLYGSIYNNKYWNECKEIINHLPGNIRVNYKKSIDSNKIYETFMKYHFAFMPSKGENFGHSIFEAFSSGCPVIISDQTPWQNLEHKKIGWDINLQEKKTYQQTIQSCIDMSQDDYDMLSQNALTFAREFYVNSEVVEKSKKIFE